jgi:hypothetical protein
MRSYIGSSSACRSRRGGRCSPSCSNSRRQPQFVYRHKWQVGDLVIWDNRCTMHRATPFAAADHVRDMRRTTIIGKAQEALVG